MRTSTPGHLWRVLEAGSRGDELVSLVADIALHLRSPDSVKLPEWVLESLSAVADVQSPDELIESLVAYLFQRQQRQHLVTPSGLAELILALAGGLNGTVLDPACGPGNLLNAAIGSGAGEVVGQEVDPALARLAAARLGERDAVRIAQGDSLLADGFVGLEADVVVCDPPFGVRHWGHEELGVDRRWVYGFPSKGDPELAWVQHCLAHAKPGGSVIIAMPASVASRRSGRSVRQAMLRGGVVRGVIELPAGVLMSTGIPIQLWVLRKPDSPGVGPILLMDVSQYRPKRRGQVDWVSIRGDVLEVWRQFEEDGAIEEIPGRQRTVEAIELLDEDVDLTPARHLPTPPKVIDLAALRETREEIRRLLADLEVRLPRAEEAEPQVRSVRTIQELARAGALEVRQQLRPVDGDDAAGGPLVLSGRDVALGKEPSMRLAPGQSGFVELRAKDLVVPLINADDGLVKIRVMDAAGYVLGANAQLIRVDDKQLDVWFLAGQLRSRNGGRTGSVTASGVHRVDVRRVEVPMLDLEEQRRLGVAFRNLTELEDGLSRAVDLGVGLVQDLIDGLADGIVSPVN
ncbi:N-6 DNA methylase [Saccharopolyspora kobensis]|uniref:N-6 DNA methylase n=1 Tax=Saccharopolyspora kobensis TaxID=146035 RepID=UPI001F45C28A|nr:N-6 DNA methylase [Saccharopolyspora kobensis]